MTREEAINYAEAIKAKTQEKIEFYRRGNAHAPEVYYSDLAFLSAAISALREQEERRWIPVTERLPDDWVDVLACLQCGDCVVAVKSGPIWRERFTNIRLEDRDITHWMPLPEPPKGE